MSLQMSPDETAIHGSPQEASEANKQQSLGTSLNRDSSDNAQSKEILEELKCINTLLKRNPVPSEDNQDTFWSTYLEEAAKHDSELMEKYKNDMDIVVFFAGLFSAVVAAFVAAMQPALSPNPNDTTNALLMILIHTIDNSTFPDSPLGIPQWNGPPYTVVCSLTLGYVSLSFSLLAALGAVVGKQWLSHFSRLGEGTNEVRARRRQQKLDGLKTWKFDVTMKVLPALLHVALALFAISLSFNLWGTNRTVAWALICTTAIGGLVYVALTVLSLWYPSCPYETPFSAATRWMIVTAIDISQYLAYHLRLPDSKPTVHPLSGLLALLLLPVFGWGAIFLAILLVVLLAAALGLMPVRFHQHNATHRRLSMSRNLSYFKDQLRPALQQYPELRSIAWILETSYHHDVIMAAVERVPDAVAQTQIEHDHGVEGRDHDVEKQVFHTGGRGRGGDAEASFDSFPLLKHLYDLFIESIVAMNKRFSTSRENRAIALGKALVGMLSQNFNSAVHPFWHEAGQEFKHHLAYSTESESTTCLLRLLIVLLPVHDSTQNRIHFQLRATQIPESLLFWSLPFLRSALRQRSNRDLIGFSSTIPQVLERVRFSDGLRRAASEQSSYFRACQAYLGMLCQQMEPANYRLDVVVGENDTAVDVRPLSNADWNVIRQILAKLRLADTSLRLKEDGCFPDTLKGLSAPLRMHKSSWPDDIRTSVHDLAFAMYSWAKDLSTQLPRRLVISAVDLAATDPNPEKHVYPDISQVRPLLLGYLVDSKHTPSDDRSMYLLKLFKSNSAQVHRYLWLNVYVVDYLIDPARTLSVQHITLEILSAACESASMDLNEILEGLVSRDDFRNYILNAINSRDSSVRMASLRFLGAALSYLLSREREKTTWQEELKRAIPVISQMDLPLGSRFCLIRIKCALYPEEYSDELSTYWAEWTRMKEGNGLQVVQVVPVAHWVLENCKQSQSLAWYQELRTGFDSLLQVAWSNDFSKLDPVSVRELITCTEKWWHSERLTPNTIAALQDPADQILMMSEKYKLQEADVNALQHFRDL